MFNISRLTRGLAIGALALLPLSAALAVAGKSENLDLDALGQTISTAFNERDADTLVEMVDMQTLGTRVAATLYENEKGRSEFARGFTKTAKSKDVINQFFAQLDNSEGSTTKFMKVVQRGEERRPLMRLDYGDAGFEYLEFVIVQDDKGRPRIVDWAPLSGGDLYSTSVGMVARLAMGPAPGLIPSFLGLKKIDEKALKHMKRIGELRKQGELQKAYDEMGNLPAEIADTRVLLVQRASLASEAGNDDAYRKTLARLDEKHGKDPAAAFMLLDHYFYAKDLRKCLGAIDAIESRVGSDGMTQLLRANIHSVMGMPKEAITHASEAVRLEPDFTTAYFSLAQSHVLVGQFGEAVGVYKTLETDFGYEFSKEGFAEDQNFKKFVASPQFKKWLKN